MGKEGRAEREQRETESGLLSQTGQGIGILDEESTSDLESSQIAVLKLPKDHEEFLAPGPLSPTVRMTGP